MRQVPILMYHWFRPAGTLSRSRSPWLEIEPETFAGQMRRMHRGGWRTVTLERAVKRDCSPRSFVLTFDDGTRDFREHARPVLDEVGFRATLFVVTGHVGGESSWDRDLGEPPRPLLDWDELAALEREGHEIASHTHGHRVLTGLDDGEALEELTRSRECLAERLSRPPAFVAYPRGFWAERHKAMARQAGYSGACAVILRWADLRRSDAFCLKRMTIKGHEGPGRFALRLWLARLVRYAGPGPGRGAAAR